MASPDFFFALDFSDDEAARAMVVEVVTRVLAQAGCGSDSILGELQAAVDRNARQGVSSCKVMFDARDGRLAIVLSSPAGELWQTTQSLV